MLFWIKIYVYNIGNFNVFLQAEATAKQIANEKGLKFIDE